MKQHIRKLTSISMVTLFIIAVLSGTAMAAGVENFHEEESPAIIETINENVIDVFLFANGSCE